jgi:hypothetical protein
MTDWTDPNKRSGWPYELGSGFLVIFNVLFSFLAGRHLGFRGAELGGYSGGALLLVVVVVGISRFKKSARTRSATAKIVFYTLLITLLGSFSSLTQSRAKRARIATEADPASLSIDGQQAAVLAMHIQDSVSKGELEDVRTLFDGDRFAKRVLIGQDTTEPSLRDRAEGASKSFKGAKLLDQMNSMVKRGGRFEFVKLYHRRQDPVLQFRLAADSGDLHYVDLYIFKTPQGNLRISDVQYYNSGEVLSKQILSTSKDLDDGKANSSSNFDELQRAIQLAAGGKVGEAYSALESLPDTFKERKAILSLRIRLGYQVNVEEAERLLDQFRKKFPDDPTIFFYVYTAATAKGDLKGAIASIDDIYRTVDGDEYLLWLKVNLFLMQRQNEDAIELLSRMESDYHVNVSSQAKQKLPKEFLTSKEYKRWLAQHKIVD